ncbi:type IV pilus assembly protein PilP [Chitinivorax tropicus]|uniref:Type IV pilus assembly protein PilP n=1 Tax=Chitinivorax tropicus TaxID=714531 RepID=A0A840MQF7_9PROT|nr:pilus assembly protein PilP [Chitinivorax tropicus]MBB5017481.1 type IV pilus assembly protein PilP [Chitinivorax tropicus]
MKKTYLLYPVLMASSLLVGCAGEEFGDLKTWMDQESSKLQGKVEPLPEVKPYEPYAYDAFNLTDPFNTIKLKMDKSKSSAFAPDTNRPKEPLESFDLEKLKMVGTLSRAGVIYALVRTPDNTMYRVKTGNYIGQNFGLITGVTESEVKIKEIVEDSNGDWIERASSIALDEQQQEQKK